MNAAVRRCRGELGCARIRLGWGLREVSSGWAECREIVAIKSLLEPRRLPMTVEFVSSVPNRDFTKLGVVKSPGRNVWYKMVTAILAGGFFCLRWICNLGGGITVAGGFFGNPPFVSVPEKFGYGAGEKFFFKTPIVTFYHVTISIIFIIK
jgi:hypothetical protein